MNSQTLLTKLIEKQDLSIFESQLLMKDMLLGNYTHSQIASILTALRMKGETVDEIVGFVKIMRKHMIKVETDGVVIDTCGTGGDGKGTFNISTAAAFVVAGAGVKVAKHGNRAASSRCGSADVLEALGVNIQLLPTQAAELLKKTNFIFMFAPLYHPSMKHVAPVRKELKIRTVFNYLGPMVNPAKVRRQIIGVPDKDTAKKLAQVALALDYEHLLIMTGKDGMDEISVSGETHVFEVRKKTLKARIIHPENFGLKCSVQSMLLGGNPRTNASIIQRILVGGKGAYRDVVLLNAAAAIFISGKAHDLKEGILLAQKSIDSGRAYEALIKTTRYSTQ